MVHKLKLDYNIIAPHFSEKRRFIWPELKPFLNLVKEEDRVLDVGCGNGRLLGALRDKKVNYLGIDFSKELLAIAKNNYPQAKLKLGDLSREKTWRNLKNFDICFCLAVLHHFPTPEKQKKILQSIHKALKNKGLLIISVWNLGQPKFWPLHLKQLPWKIKKGLKFQWLKVPYKVSNGSKMIKRVDRFYYCFSKGQLEKLLKKAGFTIIEKTWGRNFCLVGRKIV